MHILMPSMMLVMTQMFSIPYGTLDSIFDATYDAKLFYKFDAISDTKYDANYDVIINIKYDVKFILTMMLLLIVKLIKMILI